MSWQLQEAKNHLSEVVQRAITEGPQTITRHGKPAAVVISAEQYRREARRERLSRVLRACPVKGWKIERSRDVGRTLKLA
ncbi:MAG TPA: type II toxin-antitoxin system Phd/YefM family antitoxin [Candidatus Methylacidiphilales bacterium]|nr:type II toxin-antitoxin system Phd/YefM family antitoxin [Candidatus Methylacidiphilales bacterium]